MPKYCVDLEKDFLCSNEVLENLDDNFRLLRSNCSMLPPLVHSLGQGLLTKRYKQICVSLTLRRKGYNVLI